MGETLYIKIDYKIRVNHSDVTLKDIAKLECTDQTVKNRLNTLKVLKIPDKRQGLYVLSILKIIELIHEIYPDLEIQNMGEKDFIIEYHSSAYVTDRWEYVKAALVCLTVFFGSAFSIMAFHNDIDITRIFGQLYQFFTGRESDGFTVLEFTYSIGITVGIISFYNHFGTKRLTADPTPIEVQVRQYEDDVDLTVIAESSRKGTTIDVD